MVRVDKEKCIGCGSCVALYQDVFEMIDGKANIKNKKIIKEKETIEACPFNAIE